MIMPAFQDKIFPSIAVFPWVLYGKPGEESQALYYCPILPQISKNVTNLQFELI